MNILASAQIINPYNKTDECSQFTIDDISSPFALNGLTTIGQEYTFSLWIKADTDSSITLLGTTFKASETWQKHFITFTATSEDLSIFFDSVGAYYVYQPQLEMGNKVTDWTPAPEDTNESITSIDGEVKNIKESVDTVSEECSSVAEKQNTYLHFSIILVSFARI